MKRSFKVTVYGLAGFTDEMLSPLIELHLSARLGATIEVKKMKKEAKSADKKRKRKG